MMQRPWSGIQRQLLKEMQRLKSILELYQIGGGVEQDLVKAMEWHLKAANQGDTVALHSIAVLYENGFGFPQDYSKAIE
jgi:TPR repeat protein